MEEEQQQEQQQLEPVLAAGDCLALLDETGALLQCRVLSHNAHRKSKAQFTHAILEQQPLSTSPATVESTEALSLPAQFAIQVCRTDIFIGFRSMLSHSYLQARLRNISNREFVLDGRESNHSLLPFYSHSFGIYEQFRLEAIRMLDETEMHREWGMPDRESYASCAEGPRVKQRKIWGGLEIQLKPRQFPDCVIHIRAVRLIGKANIVQELQYQQQPPQLPQPPQPSSLLLPKGKSKALTAKMTTATTAAAAAAATVTATTATTATSTTERTVSSSDELGSHKSHSSAKSLDHIFLLPTEVIETYEALLHRLIDKHRETFQQFQRCKAGVREFVTDVSAEMELLRTAARSLRIQVDQHTAMNRLHGSDLGALFENRLAKYADAMRRRKVLLISLHHWRQAASEDQAGFLPKLSMKLAFRAMDKQQAWRLVSQLMHSWSRYATSSRRLANLESILRKSQCSRLGARIFTRWLLLLLSSSRGRNSNYNSVRDDLLAKCFFAWCGMAANFARNQAQRHENVGATSSFSNSQSGPAPPRAVTPSPCDFVAAVTSSAASEAYFERLMRQAVRAWSDFATDRVRSQNCIFRELSERLSQRRLAQCFYHLRDCSRSGREMCQRLIDRHAKRRLAQCFYHLRDCSRSGGEMCQRLADQHAKRRLAQCFYRLHERSFSRRETYQRLADQHTQRRLAQCFYHLRERSHSQREVCQRLVDRHAQRRLSRCFYHLRERLRSQRETYQRLADRHAQRRLAQCFYHLRERLRSQRETHQRLADRHAQRRLARCFYHFRERLRSQRETYQRLTDRHAQRRLAQCFYRLRQCSFSRRKVCQRLADRHAQRRLAQCFYYLRERSFSRREVCQRLVDRHTQRRLAQCFYHLRECSFSRREVCQRLVDRHTQRRLAQCFYHLRERSHSQREACQRLVDRHAQRQLAQCFHRFRKRWHVRDQSRQLAQCFYSLRDNVRAGEQMRREISRRSASRRLAQCFYSLREAVRVKAQQLSVHLRRQARRRSASCLARWRRYVSTRRNEREGLSTKRGGIKPVHLKALLQLWKARALRKAVVEQIEDEAHRAVKRRLLSETWVRWNKSLSLAARTRADIQAAELWRRQRTLKAHTGHWRSAARSVSVAAYIEHLHGLTYASLLAQADSRTHFLRVQSCFYIWQASTRARKARESAALMLARARKRKLVRKLAAQAEQLQQRRHRHREALTHCVGRQRLARQLFLEWYWSAFDDETRDALTAVLATCDPALAQLYGPRPIQGGERTSRNRERRGRKGKDESVVIC